MRVSVVYIFLSLLVVASVAGCATGDPSPTASVGVQQTPTVSPSVPTATDTARVTATWPPELVPPVTFSHGSGSHRAPLSVSMSSEGSEEIRYTLDGSDPNRPGTTVYEGEITLLESTTVKAVAIGPHGGVSVESSVDYTLILPKLDPPRLSSRGGVYGEPQTVSIDSGEPDATVYYTLDGSVPSSDNGTVYDGPLALEESVQLRAVNVRPGATDSDISSADFQIYGSVVEQTGDIELSGDEELVIEDTLFLHEGNITLRDNARFVVRNSFVRHLKDFAFEYEVTARENSQIVFENAAIGSRCTGSFNYAMLDSSTLQADNVRIGDGNCNVWVFMSGTTSVAIDDWDRFGGTVCDGSDVQIDNSEELEVEFCFPGNSVIDTSLPEQTGLFSFGPDPSNGVEFALNMQHVTMEGWGINVLPGSDITIRDSGAITIGVIVGGPWSGETVELDGLAIRKYDEQSWQIGPDASLTLINTTVYGWEPNVFADNTLVITNSNYTASTVNSGQGHYEISGSTVNLLSATEGVTMTVSDSVITGDVIANDDSLIILINSEVRGTVDGDNGLSGGNVFARGNGKVILRNSTVAGETVEEESGEVVIE